MPSFFNLYPGSETILSKSNKLVVAVDEFSREPTATGFELVYNEEGDVNGYYTIFPVKSALPARLKTHLMVMHSALRNLMKLSFYKI